MQLEKVMLRASFEHVIRSSREKEASMCVQSQSPRLKRLADSDRTRLATLALAPGSPSRARKLSVKKCERFRKSS